MDYKEINKKGESELHKTLAESRDKMRSLRFKAAANQLKNIREIREVKRLISRILTKINSIRKEQKNKK